MDHRYDYFKLSEMASVAIEKYNTRIRIDDNMKDELTKLIEEKNISLSNPCVISPGEQNTPEQSNPVVDGEESEPSSPTVGPHPRRDEPTPTKKVCAKCGADLTGHATMERGGKTYCALPGCGYPEREKAEAT